MTPKLQGVVPAIGTPLLDGDIVDTKGLRNLTGYLLRSGVHGILANGSMGGFAYLPDEEQLRAIEIVVAEVDGRIPVLGGLGETGTVRAVRKARQIARLGVSHLSILPPFYFFTDQEQLIAYFSEIAAAVDLPLFVYDNPALTKNKIQPKTVLALKEKIPNLVGIKESDQDCVNLQELIRLTGADPQFSILTGSEFLFHTALRMGCDGGVGGQYNFSPHIAVKLYGAFRRGDEATAAQLQRDQIDAWRVFAHGSIWGGYDEAMRYLGICQRATGAPYVTAIGPEDRAAVHAILDRYVKPYL